MIVLNIRGVQILVSIFTLANSLQGGEKDQKSLYSFILSHLLWDYILK